MEYKLGPWLPDVVDFRNPGLETVVNAVPGPNGYRPAREPVSTGATVPGTIIGASSVYDVAGAAVTLVATTQDLYTIKGGTVTASSLSLSLPSTDFVAFEQFDTKVFATTKTGATWVLSDIETDLTFSLSAGSPPSANAIGRVADFLVMGDLTDIDASDAPYRLRWSRYNDPEGSWETSIAFQAGAIDMDASFGPVTAIKGGTFGLVFQTRGVSRMTYTGGPTVFDIDTFEENRGCVAPASAVRVGDRAYYLSHDGFFVTDGTTPQPISTRRVWDWFLDEVNQTFLPKVVGAVDYQRRCIVWLFPQGETQAFTGQLWYYWQSEQWGYVSQPLEWVVEGAKLGLTLEQVSAAYPNLDAMPLSLDSDEFKHSGRNVQVLSGGTLSNLTGPTLAAEFGTGDMQPVIGKRSFVSEVTPLVESDTVNVRIGSKDRMVQDFSLTPSTPMGPVGFAPFNVDARYFRVFLDIPRDTEWRDAYGFQMDVVTSGST